MCSTITSPGPSRWLDPATPVVGQTSPHPVRLHDFADEFAFDEGEVFVAAEVGVGELVLVEAELVLDGRVDVAEVVRLLDRVQADGVGRADDLASF